jgi:hypothetical protein
MATLKVTNIKNESFAGDQLYLKTDGKIGIGTTSPQRTLHLSSNNTVFALTDTVASTDQKTKYILSDAGILAFGKLNDAYDTAAEFLRFDNDGDVGIGGNGTGNGLGVYLRRSSPTTTNFYEASDGTKTMITGVDSTLDYIKIGSLSAHRVGIVASNGEKLSVLTNGNIGIGTTSPTNKLEISGGLVRCLGTASARFTVNNGAAEGFFGWNSGTLYLGGASALLNIAASGSNNIQLETNSSTRMTIKSDGDIEVGGNLKTNNITGKNLIINGAFTISQRGTSSTDQSYMTVDRFSIDYGGHDEVLTQSQHALTSSDTGPWEKGFRYSYHIQNGNQTSGADAADYIRMVTRLEAQDLANSGWHYTSSSSYATLSFWVKSSVAQTFYGQVFSQDGSPQNFPFSTGALSANTWTKVEISIPGATNVQFDNNNKQGMVIYWWPFGGTNYTGSPSLNTWAGFSSGNRIPDMTSTWWTTNDATFELTGIQLEVGSIATEFEHRSYGEELALCQRYYQRWKRGYLCGNSVGTSDINIGIPLCVPLRSVPTIPAINMHRSGNKTVTVSIVSYEYSDVNSMILELRVGNWTGGNAVVDEVAYVLIPSGDTMELNAEL